MTIRDYFSVMTFGCDYPDAFIVCHEGEEVKEFRSFKDLMNHFGNVALRGVKVVYGEVSGSEFEYYEYDGYPESSLYFYIYI